METYDGIEIIVKNDDEGFLGSDPQAVSEINFIQSISSYNNELYNELKLAFPRATFTLDYGPYSGKSVIILTDWDNDRKINFDEISEEVDEIVGRIYNRGTFWVYN